MESLPSLLLLRKVSLFVEELLNGTRELRIKRHFALMEALDRLAITSDQELMKVPGNIASLCRDQMERSCSNIIEPTHVDLRARDFGGICLEPLVQRVSVRAIHIHLLGEGEVGARVAISWANILKAVNHLRLGTDLLETELWAWTAYDLEAA